MEAKRAQNRKRNRMLLDYTWKVRGIFGAGLLFTALGVLADLVGPYIVSLILDHELVQGVGVRDSRVFMGWIGVFVVAFLISGAMRFAARYYFQQTAHTVTKYMQEDLFDRLQRFPISYFDSLPAGKVVSRITNDTRDVKVLYQAVLADLLNAFVYGLGIYGALFFLDRNLFLLALIPMPILLFAVWDYRRKASRYNQLYRSHLSQLNANLNENIQGMEIIQAFRREEDVFHEFDEVSEALYTQARNLVRLESYSSFNITGTLQYLSIVGILFYFGYGNLTGAWAVSIGYAYIFIDYMMKIFNQAQGAFQRIGQLERANTAADHVLDMLTRPVEEIDTRLAPLASSSVAFENVGFSYVEGEPVLRDLSFTIGAGETAAFVGHTGSGKSTIMNLLFRFYEPDSGTIRVGGEDVSTLSKASTRRKMAIVLQDPILMAGNLYDNIALYDPDISREAAEEALIRVGGRALLREGGLDKEVHEKGSSLSAGERQLITFARALVRDPDILVLDEATANVDSETEAVIQRGMEVLARGRTTLVIAHRLSTIKEADAIYVLENGRIGERGDHAALIAKRGVYYRMYVAQSREQSA